MNGTSCLSILQSFIERVPSNYTAVPTETGCMLETPFYLPDNTRLGLHLVIHDDDKIEITDFGETVDNLFLSGVTVGEDDHRFDSMRVRFGVNIDGGEISSVTNAANLDQAINGVIHAMLDMSYLVYTRQVRATPSFFADVDLWLSLQNRTFERNVEVAGRANVNVFDYVLPRRGRPLALEAISTRNAGYAFERAQVTSFKVVDSLGGTIGEQLEFACLLDDRTPQHQDALTERVVRTLQAYVPQVIFWSDEMSRSNLLAA